MCKNCKKYPATEYEDEIRYSFILKTLRGRFKYDPSKQLLTNFINRAIFWTIQHVFHEKQLEPPTVPLNETLIDPTESIEDSLDHKLFERKLSQIRPRIEKKIKGNRWLKVFQLRKQGYDRRSIGKTLKVSTVSICSITEELKEAYTNFINNQPLELPSYGIHNSMPALPEKNSRREYKRRAKRSYNKITKPTCNN